MSTKKKINPARQRQKAAEQQRQIAESTGAKSIIVPIPNPPRKGADVPDPPRNPRSQVVFTQNMSRGPRRGFRNSQTTHGNLFNASSVKYINAVVNPFGTDDKGIDHIDRNAGVKIPASAAANTFTYTYYREFDFVANAGYRYALQLTAPTTDKGISVMGVQSLIADAAPTIKMGVGNSGYQFDGASDNAWLATTLIKSYRIVAAGIKLNLSSPTDLASGVLKGSAGDDTSFFPTTFGTVGGASTWAALEDSCEQQSFMSTEGITVRFDPFKSQSSVGPSQFNLEYFSTPTAITNSALLNLPRIFYSGGAEGQSFHGALVMYLECVPTDKSNCPLNLGYVNPSNDWQGICRLLSNRGQLPVVAHGHSFSDFIKGVGNFFKNVGQGAVNILKNPQTVTTLLNVAKMIGLVV